jgi:hypothetical protein
MNEQTINTHYETNQFKVRSFLQLHVVLPVLLHVLRLLHWRASSCAAIQLGALNTQHQLLSKQEA